MKLTNPTDDELNAAFAEKVAGWCGPTHPDTIALCDDAMNAKGVWWLDPEGKLFVPGLGVDVPRFTRSADAVMPWLEKCKTGGLWVYIYDHTNGADCGERDWLVSISNRDESDDNFEGKGWKFWEGASPTFPRAAVIALLRANGIEVEFKK